uniref:DUF4142 domain-containing protein n=1 Tax=Pedobacter schmidteae TaxID=2201271 RepID=UPI000EAF77B7|nr:DUF4142 domain-containing protein [Pedobacter schmidteae]
MKTLRTIAILALLSCLLYACSSSINSSKNKKRNKITGVNPAIQNPNRSVINASGDGLTPGIGQQRSAGSEENASSIASNAIAKANAAIKANREQLESMTEEELIDKMVSGLQMEMRLSSSAQRTTADQKIKYYASTILTDHNRILTELKKLSTKRNIPFVTPTSFKSSGKTDLEFVQMMIESNQSMIGLYTIASKSDDQPIKEFASKQLPLLREHLEAARELTKVFKPVLKKNY